MAFDLGSAQDVVDEAPAAAPVKRKFDLASAQDVTDAPRASSSSLNPASQYALDYAEGIKNAASGVKPEGVLDSIKHGLQGAASVASSIVAPYATIPRVLGNKFGLTDAPDETVAQSAERFTYRPDDPNAQADAATYGAVLKPGADLLSLPGKGVGKLAGAFGVAPQDAQDLGDFTNQAIAAALPLRGAIEKGPEQLKVPEIAKTPEQIARAAGLKILPSQAKSAPVGTVAETLAGSSRLAKKLAGSNEPQVLSLIAEELGLPKGTKLTPEQFAKLREPLNGAYEAVSDQLGTLQADAQLQTAIGKVGGQKGLTTNRQVARLRDQYSNLGELPAAQLVQEIRSLREKASSNLKTPFGTKDRVGLKELGKAQQEIANALDDQLERGANASGKPELVKAYKEARVALAKVGTVERAVNAPSGAAGSLLKQQNKGAPLTGRLKVIADSARAFPEVMGKPPVQTGLEGALQTGVDVATGGLRPLLSKTLVNTILGSDAYQNSIGRAAPTLGPGSALGAYFDNGSSGLSPRGPKGPIPAASRGTDAAALAGDLQLADGPLPGGPAYAGPPLSATDLAGQLGLTPEQLAPLLDDALRLTDESAPSRPIPRGSVANDLAGDLQLAPDELSLTDDAPTAPQYVGTPLAASRLAGDLEVGANQGRLSGPERQGPPQPLDSGNLALGDELHPTDNVRIVPSQIGAGSGSRMGATRPGQVDVMVGDQRLATFDNVGLAQELLDNLDQQPPEAPAAAPAAPAPKPVPGNSGAKADFLADDLDLAAQLDAMAQRQPATKKSSKVQNNASGESAASVEAVNRVASEKAAGRDRFLIDTDGSVRPLVGVDAVDAVARPGQIIVQRGVGTEDYSVLDRGGVPETALKGKIAAAKKELDAGLAKPKLSLTEKYLAKLEAAKATPQGQKKLAAEKEAKAAAKTASDARFPVGKEVETPEFKKWFGKSEAGVKDEAGKPKIFYQGSDNRLLDGPRPYRPTSSGMLFVTDNPSWASEYASPSGGRVLPLYVKAERIFDPHNLEHNKEVADYLWERNKSIEGKEIEGILKSQHDYWGLVEHPEVIKALKALGYDAAYVTETSTHLGKQFKSIAVFDQKQLKSATANKGKFDPNVDDIIGKNDDRKPKRGLADDFLDSDEERNA